MAAVEGRPALRARASPHRKGREFGGLCATPMARARLPDPPLQACFSWRSRRASTGIRIGSRSRQAWQSRNRAVRAGRGGMVLHPPPPNKVCLTAAGAHAAARRQRPLSGKWSCRLTLEIAAAHVNTFCNGSESLTGRGAAKPADSALGRSYSSAVRGWHLLRRISDRCTHLRCRSNPCT